MVTLKDVAFQKKAVDELYRKVTRVVEDVEYEPNLGIEERELLFTAPVASGKTIIVGKLIKNLIQGLGKTKRIGYVWLSSGKGNLHEQSMTSMSSYISGLKTLTIDDVLNKSGLDEGEILFANWESLRQEGNIARQDGDRASIDTCMEGSKLDHVIVFIDEAHESRNTLLADNVVKLFKPTAVVNITATPKGRLYANKVTIDALDVVNSGFIKEKIYVNEGLNSTDTEVILTKAIEKREEIEKEFKSIKRGLERVPLCLIQIENDSKVNIVGSSDEIRTVNNSQAIREMLLSKGVDDSKIAIWVSDKESCQNLENIKDSKIEYLIFKQAIATGWDCPRSHVLVRFRDVKSESFDIQTIGRILRTLEKKHYGNEIVDNAYIYTEYEDLEIKFEMDEKLQSIVQLNSTTGVIKDRIDKPLTLKSEKRATSKGNISIKELQIRVQKAIVGELSILEIDESKLKSSLIKIEANSGELLNGEESIKGEKEEVRYTDSQIKRIYTKKVRGYYKKYGIGNLINRLVLKYAPYDEEIDKQKAYLSKYTEIENIVNEEVKEYEYQVSNLGYKEVDYKMPSRVRYNYRKTGLDVNFAYAYTVEPDLSVKATNSASELQFSKYLNNNPNVDYWYKNGIGSEDFSIIYQVDEGGKLIYKEYYPDMIVVTKDKKVVIVDVKAGIGKEDYANVSKKYLEGKRFEQKIESYVKEQGFSGIEISIVKDVSKDGSGKFKKAIGYNRYSEDVTDTNSWVDIGI